MKTDDFFQSVRNTIDTKFHCVSGLGGQLVHRETHDKGVVSEFVVKASVKHVAFSLDTPNCNPFAILSAGYNTRNDLTVCCLSESGDPLVFVIECKNSKSPGNAQNQIDCGVAFCQYFFRVFEIKHNLNIHPRFLGVVVYQTKTPAKGTTRPKPLEFAKVGKHDVLRAEWNINTVLPLTALIRAAG